MKQLHRSKNNRMVAGVASGLAEYFAVDVALVRLLWVLTVIAGGAGVLAYIILWIVLPEGEPVEVTPREAELVEGGESGNNDIDPGRRQRNAGVILIGLGLIFLAGQFVPHYILTHSWPLLLVLFGLFLLFRQGREND